MLTSKTEIQQTYRTIPLEYLDLIGKTLSERRAE